MNISFTFLNSFLKKCVGTSALSDSDFRNLFEDLVNHLMVVLNSEFSVAGKREAELDEEAAASTPMKKRRKDKSHAAEPATPICNELLADEGNRRLIRS